MADLLNPTVIAALLTSGPVAYAMFFSDMKDKPIIFYCGIAYFVCVAVIVAILLLALIAT